MYYYLDITESMTGTVIRQIFLVDGQLCINFPDVDSNTGPERAAYLAWVAEGNTPLPWPPT